MSENALYKLADLLSVLEHKKFKLIPDFEVMLTFAKSRWDRLWKENSNYSKLQHLTKKRVCWHFILTSIPRV